MSIHAMRLCAVLLLLAVPAQARQDSNPPPKPSPTLSPFKSDQPPQEVSRALDSRDAAPTRTITCPTGSAPESESNCGMPFDTTNGGCTSSFPAFTPLSCGQTYCGTSAFNGSTRDTDWYTVVNTGQRALTFSVTADFRAQAGVISGTNGSGNCSQVTGLNPFFYTTPGVTSTINVCLGPGTWWFFIAPDLNGPVVPCGTKYLLSLSCGNFCALGACCVGGNCQITSGQPDCTTLGGIYEGDSTTCTASACAPPANDNCTGAQTIVCGGTYTADLRNATMADGEFRPACAPGTVASVWYKFVGTGQPISINTCNAGNVNPLAKDSAIAVYQGSSCSNIAGTVTCDDDTCGPNGLQASVCFAAGNGVTYLVQVMAYDDAARAVYQLQVACPCVSNPTGACCLPSANCVDTDIDSCDQTGGYYQGNGTVCATAACPNLRRPANDLCNNAINIAIPSLTSGYNFYATDDTGAPDCTLPPGRHGVWYRLVGDGQRDTASLCQSGTTFDTRLLLYCGDCITGDLTPCAAANDDGPGSCGGQSQVTWCSALGQVYSILVCSGPLNNVGTFQLQLSTTPGAASGCIQPVYCSSNPCQVTCPVGAISENEVPCTGEDTVDGGCGTPTNARGHIQPGQTICGTSGNYQPTETTYARDTDWFRFTISQQSTVTWKVAAEFLVQIAIFTDDCDALYTVAAEQGNACEQVQCSAVLEPGTYDVFVTPQFFEGAPCPSAWVGTLTATPTSANGACCLSDCTCTVTSRVNCQNLGGISYYGDGSTCASANCDACRADFNGDSTVNTFDLAIFLRSFGVNAGGDLNCDGATNTVDLGIFLRNFGKHCGGVIP